MRRTTPSVILLVLVSGVTFSIGDASRQAHVKRHQRYGSSKAVLRRQRPYKVQHSKPVTQALLVTNVVTFVSLFNRHNLFRALAKDNMKVRSGQTHRMLTSCFLHGSIPHLYLNMNSLHSLGSAAEPWFGSTRLACIYVTSGLAGNMLSLSLNTAPLSVGASGCIFGLLGAHMAFLYLNADFFAARGWHVSRSMRSLIDACVLTAAIGIMPGSRIDNVGHLGGLVSGAVCGFLAGPRLMQTKHGFVIDAPIINHAQMRGRHAT